MVEAQLNFINKIKNIGLKVYVHSNFISMEETSSAAMLIGIPYQHLVFLLGPPDKKTSLVADTKIEKEEKYLILRS